MELVSFELGGHWVEKSWDMDALDLQHDSGIREHADWPLGIADEGLEVTKETF